MTQYRSPLSPDLFLRNMFSAKATAKGEIIRRKKRDIERYAGMENFMREIERRGYQVAENSGNLVIFCNREPVRWITKQAAPLSIMESDAKSIMDFGT